MPARTPEPSLFSQSPDALASDQQGDVYQDPNGAMWEAVQDGLAQISPTGDLTVYPAPSITLSDLAEIASTPDGNLWFTWCDPGPGDGLGPPLAGGVGRLTPTGDVTEYDIEQLQGCPGSVVPGNDGRLWTEDGSSLLYAVTTTGSPVITSYPMDQASCDCDVAGIEDVTTGTDGAVTASGEFISSTCQSGPTLGSFCSALLTVTADGSGEVVPLGAFAPLDSQQLITSGGAVWMAGVGATADNGCCTNELAKVVGSSTTVTVLGDFVPGAIGVGPDGNVWLGGATEMEIISPDATATPVTLSGSCTRPSGTSVYSLSSGPQGDLWLLTNGGVCTATTDGTTTLLVPSDSQDSTASGIASRADGTMWATGDFSDVCGPDGQQSCGAGWVSEMLVSGVVKIWQFPTTDDLPAQYFYGGPATMVEGPDGNEWFTLPLAHQIVRVTPAGSITKFPIPDEDSQVLDPFGLAAGSDGALWFTGLWEVGGGYDDGPAIGRITTTGTVTWYDVPGFTGGGIVSGPDGALWAPGETSGGSAALFELDTSGSFTTIDLHQESGASAQYPDGLESIAVASDGKLWLNIVGATYKDNDLYLVDPGSGYRRFALGEVTVNGLATGPDGSAYFVTDLGDLGRVTAAGGFYELAVPQVSGDSYSDITSSTLTSDANGDIWLAGSTATERISTSGVSPTSAELTGGGSPVEKPTTCSVAWPVDCATGEFWHTFTDVTVPGRGVPLQFTRTYSSAMASSLGSLGYGWTDSYAMSATTDGATGAVSVHEQDGAVVTFTPDGIGGYVAPQRVLATLTAVPNADGGGVAFTAVDGTQDRFDAGGRLVSQTDRNGYVTTLAYDGSGNLTSVTDPAGRQLSFAYGSNGLISTMTQPGGKQMSFGYDDADNLTSVTDQAGGTWTFTYDGQHQLLAMTDPDNHTTANTYNGSGQVTAQVDPMNRTTTFAYAPGTTTITDPTGSVTVDRFSGNQLISSTRAAGTASAATTSYSYDLLSNGVATRTNPAGATTSSTYDASGDVTSTTTPTGHTYVYTYNQFGEPTQSTSPAGDTRSWSYDGAGNLLSSTVGPSSTTQYAYDGDPGDVTSETDPDGKVTHFAYDSDGNIASIADPLGHTTSVSYDPLGRVTQSTTPLGAAQTAAPGSFTTHYAYDALGDVTAVTDPSGHTAHRQYDGDRYLVSASDLAGQTSTYGYDADHELTRYTRANGSVVKQSWTSGGRLASRSDGLGHSTDFGYDLLGREVRATDPLGRTTRYGYDVAGSLVTAKDALGRVTTYSYNADGQVTKIAYSDRKTPTVSFSYDADGRRVSMHDGSGTASYSYTALGELKSVKTARGSLGYQYDAAGRLVRIGYPGGHQVSRRFDAAGRLVAIKDWLGHTTTFSYDANGRLTRTSLPGRSATTRGYDQSGGLTSLRLTAAGRTQAAWTLTRTRLETVAGQRGTGPLAAPSGPYTYTALNELSHDHFGSYRYDAGDQITGLAGAALSYDKAGELIRSTRGRTRTTYRFNRLGERVTAGSTTFGYDQAGRLVSDRHGRQHDSFGYDGDGLRTSARLAGTVHHYLWDPSGSLALLVVDNGTDWVNGPDGRPFEQIGPKRTVRFLQSDPQGSTHLLTDVHGKVVGSAAYTSYGRRVAHHGQSTPIGFGGNLTDPDGLVYLRARYYDPATGQFLTVDPMVHDTGQPYSYAADDPVNAADPTGRCTVTIPPEVWDYTQLALSAGCLYADGGALGAICDFNDTLSSISDLSQGDPTAATLQATTHYVSDAGDVDLPPLRDGTSVDGQLSTDDLAAVTSGAGMLNGNLEVTGDTLRDMAQGSPEGVQSSSPDAVDTALEEFQTDGFICRPTAGITRVSVTCSY